MAKQKPVEITEQALFSLRSPEWGRAEARLNFFGWQRMRLVYVVPAIRKALNARRKRAKQVQAGQRFFDF